MNHTNGERWNPILGQQCTKILLGDLLILQIGMMSLLLPFSNDSLSKHYGQFFMKFQLVQAYGVA